MAIYVKLFMYNRPENACLSGKGIYIYQAKLLKSIRQGHSCLSAYQANFSRLSEKDIQVIHVILLMYVRQMYLCISGKVFHICQARYSCLSGNVFHVCQERLLMYVS